MSLKRADIPVIENVEGPYQCPFCPGSFSINESTAEKAAIYHSLPTCKQYDDIETVEDAIRYMRCTHN